MILCYRNLLFLSLVPCDCLLDYFPKSFAEVIGAVEFTQQMLHHSSNITEHDLQARKLEVNSKLAKNGFLIYWTRRLTQVASLSDIYFEKQYQ